MNGVNVSAAGALSHQQIRTVGIAWGTYASFYLGRLNLSPALPAIALALNLSLAEVGILGTIFFWAYAAGQMINGEIGNHVRPHWVILPGLLVVALTNLLFAFQTSLWMMALLWGINGFAQSAGWGPMLRILSAQLTPDQRRRLSTFFATSFQIGNAGAWALSGLLVQSVGWQAAFWVPGLLLLGVAIGWRLSQLDTPAVEQQSGFQWREVQHELVHLLPLMSAAACVGFINLGTLIWLPTYIQQAMFLPHPIASVMTALIPLLGMFGMVFAGMLLSRQVGVFDTILVLLTALAFSLLLSALTTALLQGMFVLSIVILGSGLSGLLLSSVPMIYSLDGRASSAGGILTAVFSLGGGLSGVVIGGIVEQFGWTQVFVLWLMLALIAMLMTWSALRRYTR